MPPSCSKCGQPFEIVAMDRGNVAFACSAECGHYAILHSDGKMSEPPKLVLDSAGGILHSALIRHLTGNGVSRR